MNLVDEGNKALFLSLANSLGFPFGDHKLLDSEYSFYIDNAPLNPRHRIKLITNIFLV